MSGRSAGRRYGAALAIGLLAAVLLPGSAVGLVAAPRPQVASSSVALGEPCGVPPFIDVALDHPFCREIRWMLDAGISTGFGDGSFQPGANVTRQAMAAFMARLAGATPSDCTAPPFVDVPVGHPFCEEIGWMLETGISTGFSGGTYQPSANVTRQAMAAFLYRLNGLPVVTTSPGSTAYTEGAAPVVIDGAALTVTDADDADLSGAEAFISTGFQAGDLLGFVDQAGIVGTYDAAIGALTLSGVGSVAEYQDALRSVTYASGTNDVPVASKTVSFVVNDGTAGSVPATKQLQVTAVNDPPVAQDDAYSTDEDTPLDVTMPGIVGNDSDIDSGSFGLVFVNGSVNWLTSPPVSTAQGGVLFVGADGAFAYTPPNNFHGDDTFTYVIQDGIAGSNAATVTITVDPVNDAPIASGRTIQLAPANSSISLSAPGLLADASDADGDTLTAVVVSLPANAASFSLGSDGALTYQMAAGFTSDSFTWRAFDGASYSNTVTVNVAFDGSGGGCKNAGPDVCPD